MRLPEIFLFLKISFIFRKISFYTQTKTNHSSIKINSSIFHNITTIIRSSTNRSNTYRNTHSSRSSTNRNDINISIIPIIPQEFRITAAATMNFLFRLLHQIT